MIELVRMDLAAIEASESFSEMLLEIPELLPAVVEDHLSIGLAARSLFVSSRITPTRGHRPNLPTPTRLVHEPCQPFPPAFWTHHQPSPALLPMAPSAESDRRSDGSL